MKAILLGGAPVSEQLEQKISELKCPVYSTYGMTETVSHIALKRLNGPQKSQIFTTLPGIEIAVDTRGCLIVKGEVTNQAATVTNDIVKIINDRQFIWIGRADNVINSGGVKIQIEALEQKVAKALLDLNLPNRFFIAGAPDMEFGTVAVLFIEGSLHPDVKLKLLESIKKMVSKYEQPKRIIEVEEFELTESGKIDRIGTKAKV